MRRTAFFLAAFLCIPQAPLRPGEEKEGPKPPPPEKAEAPPAGKEGEKKAGKAEEKPKPKPKPSPNLEIPRDLSEKARAALEEAIAAFRAAEKADAERNALLKKAIDKLRLAVQMANKSPLPLYYLGQAYQMKRNFPEAKKVLEKAVKLNPRFHEAFVELGDVLVWQKDYKGSLGPYEQAIEIDPSYALAPNNKAIALVRLGRFKEAQPYLERALKLEATEERKLLLKLLEVQLQGPGWSETYIKESKNYEVMTSVSQEYAEEISKHAELIRRAYDRVFSDVKKPERKYPIWVFPDRDSYHKKMGLPPFVGGHYDTFLRKLVIFKYPKMEETLMVLYHEAFHQFLHDYLEDSPQWFNEGLADYFGAYEYFRKGSEELMRSRPNKMRLPTIQAVWNSNILPPAGDLMTMTRQEMYNPRYAGFYYAEAWAIIYSILEGKNAQYKSALMSYFKALDKGLDLNEAYLTTFGKLDMVKFDKEWRGSVKNLSGK